MQEQFPLTVDFKDGFHDDTVILSIDAKEMVHRSNVTTRTMIGLADSVVIQLDAGQHKVSVSLKGKEVSIELNLDMQSPLYLGIVYQPDKGLEYQLQGEPFKYM